jgi:hypothetical protein
MAWIRSKVFTVDYKHLRPEKYCNTTKTPKKVIKN